MNDPIVRAAPARLVSVAPMMDWTDRHCRYFLRQISRHVLLYTEMVTTGAILHGARQRFLAFDPAEHPVALQLGGSEPRALAECARIGEAFGYDEINLNCGCPSDRVQEGRFGACLMAEPALVADCVAAMRAVVHVPVTVKTRIGIDELDTYEFLHRFIATVAAAGCEIFIIHARKAWLKGLSPKENREIPPLRYDVVGQLKADFPHLTIVLNGGVKSLDEVARHLATFDGVMIGREAYSNPYLLAEVDRRFYDPRAPVPSREEIVARQIEYMARELAAGEQLARMTRHMLGLFQGLPGARRWRRYLSENAHRSGAGIEVVSEALRTRCAVA
ncbi:MAG TPA: tRNA dihydrouridine(20/20a) synthase DusA [Gammaproteobacteria bacterium]|nr:tRNA dihydrouridine(20/20a) synthase DusA [Gammaproteobacteria bacterium]